MRQDPEITFVPDNRKSTVRQGVTLLDAARRANVHISTRCGGKAACLMCKVQVEEGADHLSEPNQNERMKLGELLNQGYRLACQAKTQGSAVIKVPEDPLKAAIRAQLAKQQEEDDDWRL